MEAIKAYRRPSKTERMIAQTSYDALTAALGQLKSDQVEIEIEETNDKIVMPLSAMRFLEDILKAMSQGKPISLVPSATEVTTQKAAEMLGCSRPYLVKLLEDGEIEFTKVGKHRRIKFEDVANYKTKMKAEQKRHIIDIMNADEKDGLYDS